MDAGSADGAGQADAQCGYLDGVMVVGREPEAAVAALGEDVRDVVVELVDHRRFDRCCRWLEDELEKIGEKSHELVHGNLSQWVELWLIVAQISGSVNISAQITKLLQVLIFFTIYVTI